MEEEQKLMHVDNRNLDDAKLAGLPLNEGVKQAIRKQIDRLRMAMAEQKEHMVAVNARTGEFLADNFEQAGYFRGTGFTAKEYKKIEQCTDSVVLISSRIANERPTAQDLYLYLKNERLRLYVIICSDGTLYGIYNVSEAFEAVYKEQLDKAKAETGDVDEVNRLVSEAMYALNDGMEKRLFDVRRF